MNKKRRIVKRALVGSREVVSLKDRTGRVSIVGYMVGEKLHALQRNGVTSTMVTVCGLKVPRGLRPMPLRSARERCPMCWRGV
jgi:hypothetical protein